MQQDQNLANFSATITRLNMITSNKISISSSSSPMSNYAILSSSSQQQQQRLDHFNIYINESIEIFYEVSKWLNVIMITVITIFGLYGNLISIVIFRDGSYNKNSIKSLRVYLVMLAVSDLLVLVCFYKKIHFF